MAQVTTTTKAVETHDTDEELDELPATPLFDRGRDKKSKAITRVSIRRTDPDEGHLGYLPPEASEQDIATKYGGGTFVVQGKNDAGQIVHTMTIKIAGDPVFQSEIEEARWRRMNKLAPAAPRASTPGDSLKDVLSVMEDREAKRREEERERRTQERQDQLDREERARKEQRDHEERLAKDNAEREDRRRREDNEREDRRRVQQREDEERRAKQHREDLERQERANATALAQTQQFFQQLQAMNKRDDKHAEGLDPIKILTTGMDLALKMKGDGGEGVPTDALTALMSRLPETLSEIRSTAKEAYNEISASGKKKKIAAAAGAAPGRRPPAGDEVTITGKTATRLKRAIAILEKAGKDPEAVIDGLAGHVIGLHEKGRAAPPAPAPARKAARAARPVAKPTTVKRAAARRAAPPAAKKAKR